MAKKMNRQSLAAHCGSFVSIAATPYGICDGQSSIEMGLFSRALQFFPSDCHIIQAVCSYSSSKLLSEKERAKPGKLLKY